ILDKDERVIGVLAGRPQSNLPEWDRVVEDAGKAMDAAASECVFKDHQIRHRRGEFPTLAYGISFGGGRTAPGVIKNEPKHTSALQKLCSNTAIKRLAGFGSSVLSAFAPRVYDYMSGCLQRLLQHHDGLRLNFPCSIYPAASFNFGPHAASFKHTDAANDACNLCVITALGTFDPKTGGHIVLYALEAIIEFPSGSTVAIASAVFPHGNIPVKKHEYRQSFTQYCAGGLLRWVECGFRTLGNFATQDPEGKVAYNAGLSGRVQECIDRFSTLGELLGKGAQEPEDVD
ncbi:hypothetical protein C8Q70DRAFT_922932, partial [Cubamyces menziesii]